MVINKKTVAANYGNNEVKSENKDTSFLPQVSLIPNCNTPGNIADVSLLTILREIKNGKWYSQVKQGRSIKHNKTEYRQFKSLNVPAFTVHGPAHYASNDGMKEGNGIACADYDHVENKEEIKERAKLNPYTYSIFDSFGGDGFVILSKIPKVNAPAEFENYHSSLRQYYFDEYGIRADESAKSFKCLRLVSYDPNLFLNENSMIWKSLPTYKPTRKKVTPRKEKNHYADILPIVAKLGHNGFTDEQIRERLSGVHIDPESCLHDPEKMESLIASVRKNYTEGKEGIGQSVVQYQGFWTNNFKTSDCQLSTGLLTDVLTVLGWRILNDEYVQILDGVIHLKSSSELYQYIISLVSSSDVTFDVKDIKISIDHTTLKTRAQKELRGGVKMLALRKFDYTILRDNAHEIYFHFSNRSMKITKDSILLFERTGEKGVVWAEQLLTYSINDDDLQRPVFADFVMNVSGPDNFNAFRSAIGRALHNHNGAEGMRVPWLCDESHKAGESNGRTGKSLITKAIGKCRKMDDCHGKDFRPDNQFKFQNMTQSTQVYAIDDVKENFDFRTLYNVTSEGMEYERKNRDRVRLTLTESPQLLVTSNHPPQIEQGASTTGRLFILPVKDFYQKYADEGGVKAYHKQTFFDDWDPIEWNRFFWFMAVCAQFYLQEGYVFADQSQIRKKRLKEICTKKLKSKELADEFVDFVYSKEVKGMFTLESIIQEFGNGDIDKQMFSQCLTSYFGIEKIEFAKSAVRIEGVQKRVWIVL